MGQLHATQSLNFNCHNPLPGLDCNLHKGYVESLSYPPKNVEDVKKIPSESKKGV